MRLILRRLEERLRESEGKFEALARATSAAVFVYRGSRYLYVNRAAEDLTGYSREELFAMDAWDVIHPEFRAAVRERALARQRGEPVEKRYETKLRTKSGEERWVEINADTIRIDGEPAVVGAAFDIGDRKRAKQAEEALRSSEERLRFSLNAARVGAWEWNVRTGEVRLSPNLEELYGSAPGSWRGTLETILEIVHLEDREFVARATRRAAETGAYHDIEFRVFLPDGNLRWATSKGRVISDEKGETVRMFGVVLDVTPRKRAEQQLLERARQQAAVAALGQRALGRDELAGLMSEAAHVVSRTLAVDYSSLLELLPEARALVLRAGAGWPVDKVGVATVEAGRETPAGYALASGEPVSVEDLTRDSRFRPSTLLEEQGVVGGIWVPIELGGRPFAVLGACTRQRRRFREDEVHFLQGVANIIAAAVQRREGEAQLERSREMLRALLGRLEGVREAEKSRIARQVHDELAQVLSVLKMNISWLMDQLKEGDRPPAPSIVDTTTSMVRLIDTTVQTVRQLATELAPIALEYLTLDAAVEWQALEFQTRTGITCTLDSDVGGIRLPKHFSTTVFRVLEEALRNVENHAFATETRVGLREEEGELVLTVRDDGVGIAERDVHDPGSLGLWSIRERAGSLKGRVHIAAQEEGGTLVEVRIPCGGPRTQ